MLATDTMRIVRANSAMPHLCAWRLWAGLTQEELGARAGVTGITVWRAEKAAWRVRRNTAARLAAALGVPVEVFTRFAPSDAEAEQWAHEVAVKFAQERMTYAGPLRSIGRSRFPAKNIRSARNAKSGRAARVNRRSNGRVAASAMP